MFSLYIHSLVEGGSVVPCVTIAKETSNCVLLSKSGGIELPGVPVIAVAVLDVVRTNKSIRSSEGSAGSKVISVESE